MGASTGLMAIALPPFLTRILTPDAYGAWALALQIASYVLLLGFGLQGAVGRFVAVAHGAGAAEQRNGIVVAAFHLSSAAAAAGVFLAAGAAFVTPYFVSDLPQALVGDFQVAIFLCGAAAAMGLAGTPITGIFLGEQRAHVPASVLIIGRSVQCVLLVLAALAFRRLEAIAIAFCAGQLLILSGLAFAWRKAADPGHELFRLASATHYRELWSFCSPFVFWNLLAAASFGSDLVIVSKVDFSQTPYYSIGLTVATLFVGFLSAGYNAALPAAARRYGSGDIRGLHELLNRGGRIGIGLSLAVGVPLALAASAPLDLWVGKSYAAAAAPYVALLVIAQIIRLAMSMYGTVTIATGRHRTVLLGPLLDAIVALGFGIGLGLYMGAIGVAIGMVAGAAVNFATWYFKDPLCHVFARPHVARSFLGACLPPLAAAAIGAAAIGVATRFFGLFADDWSRLVMTLVVAGAVLAAALGQVGRSRVAAASRSRPAG